MAEFDTESEIANQTLEWWFVDTGANDPAFNMAFDEALLESAVSRSHPLMRFYAWEPPAASFGYFQRYRDVEKLTEIRPLIRRCTGGGLVPHENDWTYSVILPPSCDWFQLNARESYRRIHHWLRQSFQLLSVPTVLAQKTDHSGPGQCFVGSEISDLILEHRKLAGAAQRRNRHGLLIQGSIQPPPAGLVRSDWLKAMSMVVEQSGSRVRRIGIEQLSSVISRAQQLCAQKYLQRAYVERR